MNYSKMSRENLLREIKQRDLYIKKKQSHIVLLKELLRLKQEREELIDTLEWYRTAFSFIIKTQQFTEIHHELKAFLAKRTDNPEQQKIIMR